MRAFGSWLGPELCVDNPKGFWLAPGCWLPVSWLLVPMAAALASLFVWDWLNMGAFGFCNSIGCPFGPITICCWVPSAWLGSTWLGTDPGSPIIPGMRTPGPAGMGGWEETPDAMAAVVGRTEGPLLGVLLGALEEGWTASVCAWVSAFIGGIMPGTCPDFGTNSSWPFWNISVGPLEEEPWLAGSNVGAVPPPIPGPIWLVDTTGAVLLTGSDEFWDAELVMVVLTESPAIDETLLMAAPPVGTEQLTTWLSWLPVVGSRDWGFPGLVDSSPEVVFMDDDVMLSGCDDVRAVAVLARVSRPACGLFKSSSAANTSLTSTTSVHGYGSFTLPETDSGSCPVQK